MTQSISILGLTSKEFSEKSFGLLQKGRQHAQNFYRAFLRKGDGMLGFSKAEPQSLKLFESLEALIALPKWSFKALKESESTLKAVIAFEDHMIAELVIIPMKSGLTLCVSSQVGCKMACQFCETGRMGKLRDLTKEEIILQYFIAKHELKKDIRNIVFMGMGEPFDNFPNVTGAIDILTDPKGIGLGASRITVSTSGIVPKIYDFISYGKNGVKLAISINGSNDEVRKLVMPVNRKYPMSVLKDALFDFTRQTSSMILAEYVMLEGINDSLENAEELANYLKDIDCSINLIPYNAQSLDRFKAPSLICLEEFQAYLINEGYKVFIRYSKGDKIMAACGQLGIVNLKKSL